MGAMGEMGERVITVMFVLASFAISAPYAGAQGRTIPEAVARGATGRAGNVPSGIVPSVESVLSITETMVAGTVGKPHSYLSDDRTEVYADYRITQPIYYFRAQPTTNPTLEPAPDVVTLRGGTIPVSGIMFTETQPALPPLTPGSRVLLLLRRVDKRFFVAGTYLGAFRIANDKLIPLTGWEGFASNFTGRKSTSEAIAYMQAALNARVVPQVVQPR